MNSLTCHSLELASGLGWSHQARAHQRHLLGWQASLRSLSFKGDWQAAQALRLAIGTFIAKLRPLYVR